MNYFQIRKMYILSHYINMYINVFDIFTCSVQLVNMSCICYYSIKIRYYVYRDNFFILFLHCTLLRVLCITWRR